MPHVQVDPANVSAAEGIIPKDTPICMLNLLRWNAQAQYPPDQPQEPCSGQEAYMQRYIPAFNAVAAEVGKVEVVFLGAPAVGIVLPSDERWDVVALVRYPSLAAFRAVTEASKYKETAEAHRLAALQDWKLICTVEMKM